MSNIDIYDILYRDIIASCSPVTDEPDMDMSTYLEQNISRDTDKEVYKIIAEINNANAESSGEMSFSEAVYTIFPKVNKENNQISINEYTPIFYNGKENDNISPREFMESFKTFNIEILPLIEIANLLDVKVEKSNQIKEYGKYRYRDKKIILGSDNPLTYLHELAHAIQDFLNDDTDDDNINEQIAELAAVSIAKTIKMPVNLSYSASYLKGYPIADSDKDEVYKKVKKIVEFVKQAKNCLK